MIDRPLVSICLITYNHKEYIKQAIESILYQRGAFDYELIIADDFSTDGTREMINDLQKQYSDKIKLILQKSNVGPAQNWVDLMSAPIGKYIAYFEGDDYWTDTYKLQKQVDFLEENDAYSGCFHYTSMFFEDEPTRKGRLFGFHGDKMDFTAEDTITTLSPWHTSSFIFRKTAFELPSWLSEVASGDMALFSIVAKFGKIRCIPEEMSVYRKNTGGITNSSAHQKDNYHKNRIKLMQHLNEFHDYRYQHKVDEVIKFHESQLSMDKGVFYSRLQKISRNLRNLITKSSIK